MPLLPWIVDHKKLMEALPEELEEDMIMSYIAKTIDNDQIKKAMRMCKNVNDINQLMADKHLSDNSKERIG